MAGRMGGRWMLCWRIRLLRVDNGLVGRWIMTGKSHVGSFGEHDRDSWRVFLSVSSTTLVEALHYSHDECTKECSKELKHSMW